LGECLRLEIWWVYPMDILPYYLRNQHRAFSLFLFVGQPRCSVHWSKISVTNRRSETLLLSLARFRAAAHRSNIALSRTPKRSALLRVQGLLVVLKEMISLIRIRFLEKKPYRVPRYFESLKFSQFANGRT